MDAAFTRGIGGSAPPPALEEPSPLGRIFAIVSALVLLSICVFALTEGSANSRFLQMGAAIGAIVYLATLIDIVLGVSFLILLIGISPEVALGGLNQLRMEDFVVPPLAFAWLIRAGRQRESGPPLRLALPALTLFIGLLLSSILGISAGFTRLTQVLPILGKYLEAFLIFAIIAKNVRTEREFRALVVMSVLAGGAGTLASVFGVGESRIRGPLGETANIYGGYLALTASVALGLAVHASTPGSRLLAGMLAASLGFGVLKTYSRTSYAALATGILSFSMLRERRLLPFLLLAAVAGPFLLPDDVLTRFANIGGVATGDAPSSWEARVYSWRIVLGRIAGPGFLFGGGAGSIGLGDVDSEYFRVLADGGVLGAALFVWFLTRTFRTALTHYDRLPIGGFHKGFAAGYLMAFLALCIHAIGATSFTSIRTMEMFMVLTGLMVCQAGRAAEWGLLPGVAPAPTPAPLPPLVIVND
jgi:hypothetical protein